MKLCPAYIHLNVAVKIVFLACCFSHQLSLSPFPFPSCFTFQATCFQFQGPSWQVLILPILFNRQSWLQSCQQHRHQRFFFKHAHPCFLPPTPARQYLEDEYLQSYLTVLNILCFCDAYKENVTIARGIWSAMITVFHAVCNHPCYLALPVCLLYPLVIPQSLWVKDNPPTAWAAHTTMS